MRILRPVLVLACLTLLPLVETGASAPQPTPAQRDALLGTLRTLRATYPTPMSEAQLGEMMNRAAWTHRVDGWQLLQKATNACPVAALGTTIWCDGLIHAPSVRHYDLIVDREGAARIDWQDVGPCVISPTSGCSMDRARAPVDPGLPPPDPGPTPQPPPDLSAILQRLTQLEATLAATRQDLSALRTQHAADVAALQHLIATLPPPAIPCDALPAYKGKALFGTTVTSRPVCGP